MIIKFDNHIHPHCQYFIDSWTVSHVLYQKKKNKKIPYRKLKISEHTNTNEQI